VNETPSQTIGPFFACMMEWPPGPYAVPKDTPGAFWLSGTVYDGAGAPVPDALVEIWQPGRNPVFGRCPTGADGRYAILTVRPEKQDGAAPHVAVSVFARGLLDRLVTRIYFPDEVEANATDPVLSAIADPADRVTLVAAADDDGFRFDIHLQGEHETVFFLV